VKPAGFLFACAVVLSIHVSLPGIAADAASSETAAQEKTPIGLQGIELTEEEQGIEARPERLIIPPFYSEKKGNVHFKAVFPLFYLRERHGDGARRDLGVLPFYWQHDSADAHARVYFPFYWRFRNAAFDADIVLQTHYSRKEHGFHFGFSPLFYFGRDESTKKSYQIVLPPLFWNFHNKDGGFLYSLLYYDQRIKDEFKRGLVPLFFSNRTNGRTVTTVLPPLFWHISDPVNYATTTVLGPLFLKTREHGWSAGLLPVLYFARDQNWSRNMVLPLYYGSRVGELRSHYFPALLSYWRHSPTLRQGGVAIFYHWYRSEGEYLNMYSPLIWRWGNSRTLKRNLLIPPLFYRGKSPVDDDLMVGLIYWNFKKQSMKHVLAIMPLFAHSKDMVENNQRIWIFPTFDFGWGKGGSHFRIHPLLYVGNSKDRNHLVLAPVFWQFNNRRDRNTVVFPIWWQFRDIEYHRTRRVFFPLWWQFDDTRHREYRRIVFPFYWDFNNPADPRRTIMTFPPLFWRVKDGDSARTGVLNVSMHRGALKGNDFWTFNLFPLVLFGKPPAPDGARWELLHGLVGWRRQGDDRLLKLFWIPIPLPPAER